MERWQIRVLEECEALEGRLISLRSFMVSDFAKTLSDAEYSRLITQMDHMTAYSKVLKSRINHFEEVSV